jgi:hypothetical protein
MNKKFAMNKSLLGVAITDELHSDLGSAAVSLMDTNEETGHDYIRSGLVIRTAPSGGGTLLTDGVDYVLANENTVLSAEVSAALGSTLQCYKTVQITNVTYQSGALYFSGYFHGDAVDADRENKNKQIVISKSANYTIDNSVYGDLLIAATSGAAGIRFKTPSAILCKNKKIKVEKVDIGTGAVTILNDFSQTYQGMSYIFLFDQWDAIEMVSDGVQWLLSGTLTMQTGGINTNDWTNSEKGDAVIPYDNAAGTALVIGEKVTNGTTPANTGIIVAKTATTITLKKSTGTGIHADNNVLTGSMGGGTVLVNIPGSTSKNADSNFYHGWGIDTLKITTELWVYPGTTFTRNGAIRVGRFYSSDGSYIAGSEIIQVDTNNFKQQTGTTGFFVITETGSYVLYDSDDYSYNVVSRITF